VKQSHGKGAARGTVRVLASALYVGMSVSMFGSVMMGVSVSVSAGSQHTPERRAGDEHDHHAYG
jgi:hypothetical protein